jgi:hypothetical protein
MERFFSCPPIRYDEESFTREPDEREEEGEYWTKEASQFGKRLFSILSGLAQALSRRGDGTPPPSWSFISEYRLASEGELESAISGCDVEIAELDARKKGLESQLVDAGTLRRLLYEHGKPLEGAVIEAMKLFGFDAKPFSDGASEFDGVFVSAEGRCIGEVEGKDNRPINIDKFSQLERNLQEDFERDEVNEHAKGLLFGNAFRLKPLHEREEFLRKSAFPRLNE